MADHQRAAAVAAEVLRVLRHAGTHQEAADAAYFAVTEGAPSVDRETVTVEVWVCPTVGCGHYYAAPSAGDLAQKSTSKQVDGRTVDVRVRAACPSCRLRGVHADRVRRSVEVAL